MSSESPQAEAAGEQSEWQSHLATQLSGITLPELRNLMGEGGLSGMLSGRDFSGRMGVDSNVRQAALSQLNQGYAQAKTGSREAISYGGLRSGEGRLSPGAMGSSMMGAATSLDRDRQSALRNLEFQSAQSSLGDYNKVLQLLGQGSNTALGLSGGFSGAASSAIGGLSNQSQMSGVLGGAASGAGLGATVGGPWGALIGGVAGAAVGLGTNP